MKFTLSLAAVASGLVGLASASDAVISFTFYNEQNYKGQTQTVTYNQQNHCYQLPAISVRSFKGTAYYSNTLNTYCYLSTRSDCEQPYSDYEFTTRSFERKALPSQFDKKVKSVICTTAQK